MIFSTKKEMEECLLTVDIWRVIFFCHLDFEDRRVAAQSCMRLRKLFLERQHHLIRKLPVGSLFSLQPLVQCCDMNLLAKVVDFFIEMECLNFVNIPSFYKHKICDYTSLNNANGWGFLKDADDRLHECVVMASEQLGMDYITTGEIVFQLCKCDMIVSDAVDALDQPPPLHYVRPGP